MVTATSEHPAVVPVTVYDVVLEGETIKGLFVLPVFQRYESAPLAVKVALFPEQIVTEFTVIVGWGFTLTVVTAISEHPAVVPVTAYDVVTEGETIKGLFVLPVFHRYESAPAEVKVALSPEQIISEFTMIVGLGLTLTVAIAISEHPEEVPVTVYDIVLADETIKGIFGIGFTVIWTSSVAIHPEVSWAINVYVKTIGVVPEFVNVMVGSDALLLLSPEEGVHV